MAEISPWPGSGGFGGDGEACDCAAVGEGYRVWAVGYFHLVLLKVVERENSGG